MSKVIVGKKKTVFNFEDTVNGEKVKRIVSGFTFYVEDDDPIDSLEGVATDKFFISDDRICKFTFTPSLGDRVEVCESYRNGKRSVTYLVKVE